MYRSTFEDCKFSDTTHLTGRSTAGKTITEDAEVSKINSRREILQTGKSTQNTPQTSQAVQRNESTGKKRSQGTHISRTISKSNRTNVTQNDKSSEKTKIHNTGTPKEAIGRKKSATKKIKSKHISQYNTSNSLVTTEKTTERAGIANVETSQILSRTDKFIGTDLDDDESTVGKKKIKTSISQEKRRRDISSDSSLDKCSKRTLTNKNQSLTREKYEKIPLIQGKENNFQYQNKDNITSSRGSSRKKAKATSKRKSEITTDNLVSNLVDTTKKSMNREQNTTISNPFTNKSLKKSNMTTLTNQREEMDKEEKRHRLSNIIGNLSNKVENKKPGIVSNPTQAHSIASRTRCKESLTFRNSQPR